MIDTPKGDIMTDVLAMIKKLQTNRTRGPALLYLPDATLISGGFDPNDYPELEGFPGVRVVEMK